MKCALSSGLYPNFEQRMSDEFPNTLGGEVEAAAGFSMIMSFGALPFEII